MCSLYTHFTNLSCKSCSTSAKRRKQGSSI